MTLAPPAVMIDIETLGNAPTAAFTSIGAVLFDPRGDWIGQTFHMHVSLHNAMHHGLTVDASTLLWWLGQSEEARCTLMHGQVDPAPLLTALDALAAFIPPGVEVWCNGASFDFAILNHAYRTVGMATPWDFWKECDLRTLKRLNPDMRLTRQGTHHNAMDDAVHQARLVQHILQADKDIDA